MYINFWLIDSPSKWYILMISTLGKKCLHHHKFASLEKQLYTTILVILFALMLHFFTNWNKVACLKLIIRWKQKNFLTQNIVYSVMCIQGAAYERKSLIKSVTGYSSNNQQSIKRHILLQWMGNKHEDRGACLKMVWLVNVSKDLFNTKRLKAFVKAVLKFFQDGWSLHEERAAIYSMHTHR